MPVSAAVRAATRSRHLAMHAAVPMRRLFAADYNLPEYRRHLEVMLGVVEPLEIAARGALDAASAQHFLPRSERLRGDLFALGASPAEIARVRRCTRIPAMSRIVVDGYLYVTLGSMLGGSVIARTLRGVLGPAASVRFYGEDPDEARERWTAFCAYLDADGRGDVAEICTAAGATFDTYAAWLEPEEYAAGALAR